ncbi:PREDICTED: cytohesin-4-like isoform X1 [Nanorana parkeri]|uniref:cytohesin-4-like isoform X1 n=1 Tax=Nanorana parkeri TaxID=125878 RepID=UPI0008547480|nr:PREDICTED: cytohesin-4-like isoform X1 [Nanorana parkeri]
MESRDTARYLVLPQQPTTNVEREVQVIMEINQAMTPTEETIITSSTREELLEHIKNLQNEITEIVADIDDFERLEISRKTQRENELLSASRKFNMDPEKGIQLLINRKFLEQNAEQIAGFLYNGAGLSKAAIGEYLGQRESLNIQVLQAFVRCHDLNKLGLVEALRRFLGSFRLPGEAQKIDRIMETFSTHYCQCNPETFKSTDSCYIVCFSLIILNTSLYNPSVKEKPDMQQFVSIHKGVHPGGDLPTELLAEMYESLKKEPFQLPEDENAWELTLAFQKPQREGWLLKMGGRVKTWKKRWFILKDNCLYYFEYTTDKDPLGIIPLENLCVELVEDPKKPHCFDLHARGQTVKACKTQADGKKVQGNHQSYRLSATTDEEREIWVQSLKSSISWNPFYDQVSIQKKISSIKKDH